MLLSLEDKQHKYIVLYGLILLIIGLISVTIYFTLERALTEQKNAAYIINISGRQRMLSQFIAVSAFEHIESPSVKTQSNLETAITEMGKAHNYLSNLPNMSSELKNLYFDTENVNLQLGSYLQLASSILNNMNSDEALHELEKRRHSLLDALEKIVFTYQKEAQQNTARQHKLQLVMLILIFILLLIKAFFITLPIFKKLQLYFHLAIQDPLTSAYNRRYFLQLLEEEHKRCIRYNSFYSLCIIDIDNFKKINDRYGHPTGDKIIQKIAHSLENGVRINDKCSRIGGEEFAVLLINTEENEAYRVAEKLRKTVNNLDGYYDNKYIPITISIGVTTFTGQNSQSGKKQTTNITIKQADMALYAAKKSGRNTTHLWKRNETKTTNNTPQSNE